MKKIAVLKEKWERYQRIRRYRKRFKKVAPPADLSSALEDEETEEEEARRMAGVRFGFSVRDWETIIHWQRTHKCRYRLKNGCQYFGCIGGGYTYSFTPTGIGTIYEISCTCGKKMEFDDLS